MRTLSTGVSPAAFCNVQILCSKWGNLSKRRRSAESLKSLRLIFLADGGSVPKSSSFAKCALDFKPEFSSTKASDAFDLDKVFGLAFDLDFAFGLKVLMGDARPRGVQGEDAACFLKKMRPTEPTHKTHPLNPPKFTRLCLYKNASHRAHPLNPPTEPTH